MKFYSALLLLSLGATYTQKSHAASAYSDWYIDDWDVSIGQTDFLHAEIPLNGPAVLLWSTTGDWTDDEYFVQVRDGTTQANLYNSGQHESSTFGISPEITAPSGLYDFGVKCDLENIFGGQHCDGGFSWVMVDCGCPPDKPFKLQDCTFDSMDSATPALCRDSQTSNADVIGEWLPTGVSGPDISFSVTHGTTTTDATSVTNEQSQSFTTSISAGFEFEGFSSSVELSETQSSSVAQQVASSLSTTINTQITAACPDTSLSSNGLWFLWQWTMEQEADVNGAGFFSKTSNFVCTESNQMAPRCPLGFCADLLCQSCNAPFEHLGAGSPPSPSFCLESDDGTPYDAGFGECPTYAEGESNHDYCALDVDANGVTADAACAECGKCT